MQAPVVMKPEKRAKFIQIDKRRAKALPLRDFNRPGRPAETVVPEWNEHGYPIFDAPEPMVQHYITVQPDVYKLYDSPPLLCQSTTPEGAIVWNMMYPWRYERRTVEVDDPEKPGYTTHVWKDFWEEDRSGESKASDEVAEVVLAGAEPKPAAASTAAPTTPPLPETKTMFQVQQEERDKAAKVLGQDVVQQIEARYRAQVNKPGRKIFSKKEHFEFLKALRDAVKEATRGEDSSSETEDEDQE